MKVFDKASWQIDNGLPKEIVINHFILLFDWLNEKGYLTNAGKEILEIGIDDEISLNDGLVTEEGKRFLEMFYDKIIEESGYDLAVEESLLTEYDKQFTQK